MITVSCVLKSGGDFDAEYVERLQEGVKRHFKSPYRFVCLSDCPVPCERVPLSLNLTGWWSKLELFKLKGKVIYFDLDTVINGDLSPLAKVNDSFAMLSDLNKRSKAMTSGVMVWNGDHSHIMDDIGRVSFDNYRAPPRWGDQGWIQERVGNPASIQQRCPDGFIASHKWAKIEERQRASVVCYHGKPRPHETGWAI